MIATSLRGLAFLLAALALAAVAAHVPTTPAAIDTEGCWKVDALRAGMKGYGKTVMKGTKIENFGAEVLGVMKNVSPGRDMVLCRLSGLDLEKTGVIQGMSGSPVFIDGKLVGAVAYSWQFGKEPIAGVTPFCQMHSSVEAYEKRDQLEQAKPNRVGLAAPLNIDGKSFDAVTVSNDFGDPLPTAGDGLWMVPLRTPLAASGFTPHCLAMLRADLQSAGMVPMQGGAVSARVAEEVKDTKLEPGGALTVAMVMGDFDLSGVGTVTHVDGKRVYGWGHPMFGSGTCEFPLMTGYVHAIYPRQSISFKLASPVKTVGVINADVSTCIAGWLDRQPEMMPVKMTVARESESKTKTFNVQIVRQPKLLASLVLACLSNSIDMEGDLPEELTAEMQLKIELEGHPPIVVHDMFSGSSYSGGRAPLALYMPVANVVQMLTYNSFRQVPIKSIGCTTKISSGRRTADIESVELQKETVAPGDTVRATVYLRPYKGPQERLHIALPLPADLPDGTYTATISDDLTSVRQEIRDNPTLSNPHDIDQVIKALRVQSSVKRTNLAIRVPTAAMGVAVNGKALPNLPPGMVEIMGNSKRTGALPIGGALTARHATPWVVQGSESVRFTVTRNKRIDSLTNEE
jgi:SpoIVB peptidase S55